MKWKPDSIDCKIRIWLFVKMESEKVDSKLHPSHKGPYPGSHTPMYNNDTFLL